MSPSTISASRPSRLALGLPRRTKARTTKPALDSSRATAEPTKPEAPVMKTQSLAGTILPRALESDSGGSQRVSLKAILGEAVTVGEGAVFSIRKSTIGRAWQAPQDDRRGRESRG